MLVLLPLGARGEGFSISSGETVSTLQMLDLPGDAGVIAPGGRLEVTDDSAVFALSDGVSVLNAGVLASEFDAITFMNAAKLINSGEIAGGGMAVFAENMGDFRNSGLITGGFVGISVLDGNRIANSGRIQSEQALSGGSGNVIVNEGSILGNLEGITLRDGNTVLNTGVVEGGELDAIRADNGNTIVNAGMLRGIQSGLSVLDGNIIDNTGAVMATFTGLIAGSGNTINNSGTLAGGEIALEFTDGFNTLNLERGSNVQGMLMLGSDNRLNIAPGLNTAFRFEGTPEINTSGAPAVSAGGVLAVVDPTGFSAQDDHLADLTRILADVAGARFPARSPSQAHWVAGLGSTREVQAEGIDGGFRSHLAGIVFGGEGELLRGTIAGGFLGSSLASTDTDRGNEDLTTRDYFGGAYLGMSQPGYVLGLSIAAGVSHRNSRRTVASNMAAGGIEHAEGDEVGLFLSPAATLSTQLQAGDGVVQPSFRLRYAGLYLPGYEEDGSAADLKVDARSVHVLEARAELAYAPPALVFADGAFDAILRIGADAAASGGGNVEGELLGESLILSTGGSDPTPRGFAGFGISYATATGLRFFAEGEAGYDTSSTLSAQASAGFEVRL